MRLAPDRICNSPWIWFVSSHESGKWILEVLTHSFAFDTSCRGRANWALHFLQVILGHRFSKVFGNTNTLNFNSSTILTRFLIQSRIYNFWMSRLEPLFFDYLRGLTIFYQVTFVHVAYSNLFCHFCRVQLPWLSSIPILSTWLPSAEFFRRTISNHPVQKKMLPNGVPQN